MANVTIPARSRSLPIVRGLSIVRARGRHEPIPFRCSVFSGYKILSSSKKILNRKGSFFGPEGERRRFPRLNTDGQTRLVVPGEAKERSVDVVNVSGEGTFLRTTPIPLGTEVKLSFAGDVGMEMRGEVIRNDSRGVGFRLLCEGPDTLSVWLKQQLELISPSLPDPWSPLTTRNFDATGQADDADISTEAGPDEPVYIPTREVAFVLDSCPGTSLELLLSSHLAPTALVLVAVGRLMKSGSIFEATDETVPTEAPLGPRRIAPPN